MLEAAVSTYSTGPVGPGDHYNMTNRDIVMLTWYVLQMVSLFVNNTVNVATVLVGV